LTEDTSAACAKSAAHREFLSAGGSTGQEQVGEIHGGDEQNRGDRGDALDLYRCPKCGGPMKVIERLTAAEILLRSPPEVIAAA
jgi:hypothetical protein